MVFRKKYCFRFGLLVVAAMLFLVLSHCTNKFVFPGQSMINPDERPVFMEKISHPYYHTFSVNGETLEGWSREVPGTPLIVYYGGNAEDVLYRTEELVTWGCSFLAVNYRGFGRSTGSPSQKNVVDDAVVLLDLAVSGRGKSWDDVVLLGQSIGSGVAVQVASQRPVSKMVLLVPFDSLESVAKEMIPWLPVSWLLDSPFRSDELAPGITCPVAIYAAEEDRVIPVHHARNLARLFPNLTNYRELPGISHMGLLGNPRFSKILRQECCEKSATKRT